MAGERYPQSDEEWEEYLDKYKAFPEYQRVNRNMTLDEFKTIYFWEWLHRQWGRSLGVVYAAPLAAFALAGRIPAGQWPRLLALLALGGGQGAIGWWMVKSGLEHDRFGEFDRPRVSPYRLAAHLGMAFTLYSGLVWTGLDILHAGRAPQPLSAAAKAAAARLRGPAGALALVVAATAASGAFVAGNDAGHAFNDWPLFAGRLVPEGIWLEALGLRNLFENTATVQFDHRMLAYSTLAAVGLLHARVAAAGGAAALPPAVRTATRVVAGVAGLQVCLGISTLLLYVPVSLGAAHQAGALALLTAALSTLHSLKAAAAAPLLGGGAAAAAAGGGNKSAALAALAFLALPRDLEAREPES